MFIGEIEEVGVIEPVVAPEPRQEDTDAEAVHPSPKRTEPVPA